MFYKFFFLFSLNVYEEVNGGDFSISNIKYWDLFIFVLLEIIFIIRYGFFNFKRSFSMDSLMGNLVYCDFVLIVNFRDDSEIYVDSVGYVMFLGSFIYKTLGNFVFFDIYLIIGGVRLY